MTRLRAIVLTAALLLLMPLAAPLQAQGLSTQDSSAPGKIPEAQHLEVLIKQALLMLNDANLANNYTVFHARIAPAFRRQYSVERIAAAFKVFRERGIDFALVAAHRPEMTEGPRIDSNGVLAMKGIFPTEPSRVHFDLTFANAEGKWLILGIHVNVKPKDE
jgi:hypothetical protein